MEQRALFDRHVLAEESYMEYVTYCRSRHSEFYLMKSQSAFLIYVFTGIITLFFTALFSITISDWNTLCFEAIIESETYNEGFRRQGAFSHLDATWQQAMFLEHLSGLPAKDQHLFITAKVNAFELPLKQAKNLVKHLSMLNIDLTREFILGSLLPGQPLEKRRRAAEYSTVAGLEWSRCILTEIALNTNEDSFLRRKALKLVGMRNISVNDSIDKLLTDEDIILRKISGKYLLALAKGNDELQLKVFGALRCEDIQWVQNDTQQILSPDDMHKIVVRIARLNRLDPILVLSVIKAESNFDPLCVSRAGAQGLMQLMPKTAESVGVEDPFDVNQNILGGVTYLKKMMVRFGNNIRLALAAYNAGPTTVARYKGVPPYKETKNYIKKVMKFMEDYRADSAVNLPRS